ncbi:MAG: PTS fructose transporter subunit IIA [Nitrosomonadales bacterium]|nr:MAG: PTS fructose transporter subunit IIA [Nitrosomonadales bacterium]
MIGILIIAHGTLGESLIHCASHVMGKRPDRLRTLGVTIHDDPNALLPQAQGLVRELDEGDGVLVLSDMYGATPCNIACKLLVSGRIEGIAGVNLPMLVRALSYRNEPLEVLIERAISGGAGGVIHFTPEVCKA